MLREILWLIDEPNITILVKECFNFLIYYEQKHFYNILCCMVMLCLRCVYIFTLTPMTSQLWRLIWRENFRISHAFLALPLLQLLWLLSLFCLLLLVLLVTRHVEFYRSVWDVALLLMSLLLFCWYNHFTLFYINTIVVFGLGCCCSCCCCGSMSRP